MKIVWTDEALRDLDEIAEYLAAHCPNLGPVVEDRIRAVVARTSRWPQSARESALRASVQVVPLGRFPYKSFYQVVHDWVDILHVHHTAREPGDEPP